MKVSVRIAGKVTSISVRNSLCALHYMFTASKRPASKKVAQSVQYHVTDFAHKTLTSWPKVTGKGLSGFIQDCMIEDILENEDLKEYKAIMQQIGGTHE
jgi:hypothetical protein